MSFDEMYRLSCHAVITNDDGQILQLKATYADCGWGLPGGALDRGESIHDALNRECLEELGCPLHMQYLSGVYYHAAVNSHAFIFRCQLPEQAVIQLSDEHSAYHWFNLDQLSAVQQIRVKDCLDFTGHVISRCF